MKTPYQSTHPPSQQDPLSPPFKKKVSLINPDQIYSFDCNPIDLSQIKLILRENYALKERIKLLEEQIKRLEAKIPTQESPLQFQNQPLDFLKFKIERSNSLVVIQNPSEMSSEQNSALINHIQRKQSIINVQTGSDKSVSLSKEFVNIFQNSNVTISVIDSENEESVKKSSENLGRAKAKQNNFVIFEGNKVQLQKRKGSERTIKYEEDNGEHKNIDFMISNATQYLDYDMNNQLQSIFDQDDQQQIEQSTVLESLSVSKRSSLTKTQSILKKSSLNKTKAKKLMKQTEQINQETDEHDDDQQQQRATIRLTIGAKGNKEGQNKWDFSQNFKKEFDYLKIYGEIEGAIQADPSTALNSQKTTIADAIPDIIGYIKLTDKRQSQLSEIKQNQNKEHEQNQEMEQQTEKSKSTILWKQDIKIKYESIIKKLLEKIKAITNKNQQLSSLISGLKNKFKEIDDRSELSWPMTRRNKRLQKLREQSKECSFEDEKQTKIPHYIHRKQRVKQIKTHNFHKYS